MYDTRSSVGDEWSVSADFTIEYANLRTEFDSIINNQDDYNHVIFIQDAVGLNIVASVYYMVGNRFFMFYCPRCYGPNVGYHQEHAIGDGWHWRFPSANYEVRDGLRYITKSSIKNFSVEIRRVRESNVQGTKLHSTRSDYYVELIVDGVYYGARPLLQPYDLSLASYNIGFGELQNDNVVPNSRHQVRNAKITKTEIETCDECETSRNHCVENAQVGF